MLSKGMDNILQFQHVSMLFNIASYVHFQLFQKVPSLSIHFRHNVRGELKTSESEHGGVPASATLTEGRPAVISINGHR